MDIHGTCHARFVPLRDAFEPNFNERGKVLPHWESVGCNSGITNFKDPATAPDGSDRRSMEVRCIARCE